jgi:uncharacterized protein (DUF2342 family)
MIVASYHVQSAWLVVRRFLAAPNRRHAPDLLGVSRKRHHTNRSKVFEPAAVDLLVRATAGVPRSVCLLARAAWLEAARAEAREINAQTLQLAMDQVPGLVGLIRHNS